MKKIIRAWPLLIFIPGAVLFVFANYYMEYLTTYLILFLASLLIVSIGVLIYARNKDKREGKRYLIVKRKKP